MKDKTVTVLNEVRTKMDGMIEKKRQELAEIRQKMDDAKRQAAEADAALKRATEHTDLKAYEKARSEKASAQTALEMFSGRYGQIENQEYISEEESLQVINGLFEYEKSVTAEFKAALADQLRQLVTLRDEYQEEENLIRATLTEWHENIRTNYSTFGQSSRIDPETGERTDKSDRPVSPLSVVQIGCGDVVELGNYLNKNKELLNHTRA